MESKVRHSFYILTAGVVSWASLIVNQAYAASAALSLSPSSSSVSQGSTLTVTVRMNSDEPVNAVQANLSYPANLLDFVSIGSTSAFSIVAQSSGGGGSVQIGRGALPAVSGSQSVATVRFRAKTNTGTAAISFTGGSSVVSANSNNNIMTGSSGGNYSLKAPTVAAPVPEVPKDTIPPTIKDLKVAETTTNSATITWTTSEPATSEVNYGLNKGYGLSKVDATMVTEHKVVLDSPLIAPATDFHFMVKSVDPAGNAVSSEDGSFTTAGATLNVTVLNQDKKPVSGAKVTLAESSATTDKKGKAQLKNLPIGKVYGVVEHKGDKTVISASIAPIDPKAEAQSATFNIKTSSFPLVAIVPIALLLVALLWLGYKKMGYKPLVSRLKALKSPRAKVSTADFDQKIAPEPPTIRPTEVESGTKKLP